MKKILFTLAMMLSLGLCANAQTVPDDDVVESDENVQLQVITPAEPVQETKEEIKAREKKLREFNDQAAFAKAANSLRRGYFVLVADNIQIGSMGYKHYDIRDNYNFILVQGEDGIIQYALNTVGPGSNGLGGWTGKGNVRKKRLSEGKNGDVHLQYELVGSSVNATVNITLFNGNKRAVATISGGVPITIYGDILPYRDKNHR